MAESNLVTYGESPRSHNFSSLAEEANAADAPNSKASNPKDAVGIRKARWFSFIPNRVLAYVGLALLEGARKYGKFNWREAGVKASVYIDACVCGHLQPWVEGEDVDPDSGLSHIDKAIASLIVLRDGMLEGNWVDDRPPAIKDGRAFWDMLNKQASDIIDRYPEGKEPFTQARRLRESEDQVANGLTTIQYKTGSTDFVTGMHIPAMI